MPSKKSLASQLENRKHNLAVIQEAIESDGQPGEKLLQVRDFLTQRILVLERELVA